MKEWMEKRSQLIGWMTGGSVAGSIVSFFAGFAVGILENILSPHVAAVSGFDLHSMRQHTDQPQTAIFLPWILMFTLGYSLSKIANAGFECAGNPSCIPYPNGPFGGGSGGGW